MFVLGTAGHIDHGKSSLIMALTGIDPDRLPEEKQRGMTIDLGFAWMKLPGGGEIGLVDVPGHERFVRNMVAGAGGINAAMLVIAADDGWMPQTQEHLDILNLLDIKHGFVALTKIDLVDADWVELIRADIEDKLKGTCLDGAPIVACSSETKEGIDRVIAEIETISRKLQAAEDIGKSRLFIDRSFVLTGIGVVVTGTSRGGGFASDSDAFHFPSGDKIRIRSLQSHERQVTGVEPGTRVAINITGADRKDITRGQVITNFPYHHPPSYFAVSVKNLGNSAIALKEGRKVLIIHGTTETEAIIRPFADKGISPGTEGFAVIKTNDPLAAFISDRFILRLPTPQKTIGGGRILDILDLYPRRKALPEMGPYLQARQDGSVDIIVATELHKRLFSDRASLLTYSNFSALDIQSAISAIVENGAAILYESYVADAPTIEKYRDDIVKTLERTHRNKSYAKGLSGEELSRRIKREFDTQSQLLFKYMEGSGAVKRTQQFYHLPGFAPQLDADMQAESERILTEIKQAGHNYLSFEEIEQKHKNSRKTLNFLRENGQLIAIGIHFIMTTECWNEIVKFLEDAFTASGKLSLAEFRDHFKTTRKYALPLLEYLDQLKITAREGDYRIKGIKFDERHSL